MLESSEGSTTYVSGIGDGMTQRLQYLRMASPYGLAFLQYGHLRIFSLLHKQLRTLIPTFQQSRSCIPVYDSASQLTPHTMSLRASSHSDARDGTRDTNQQEEMSRNFLAML